MLKANVLTIELELWKGRYGLGERADFWGDKRKGWEGRS